MCKCSMLSRDRLWTHSHSIYKILWRTKLLFDLDVHVLFNQIYQASNVFFIDKCLICNSWNWLQLCKNRFWNWAKKHQLLVVEDCYQGHFHFHKIFWWRTEMLLKLLGLSNWKARWQKVNQWKYLLNYIFDFSCKWRESFFLKVVLNC